MKITLKTGEVYLTDSIECTKIGNMIFTTFEDENIGIHISGVKSIVALIDY